MRADYCPMANEPCQCMCDQPCSAHRLQPRKAVKLTTEEVAAIVKKAAKGGPLRRDGSTSERIARATEQAVWEKLGVTE